MSFDGGFSIWLLNLQSILCGAYKFKFEFIGAIEKALKEKF